MKRFSTVLLLFILALQFPPAFGESFCDWALRKSESLESSHHPYIQLSLSRRAADSAYSRGISKEELALLIQKSEVDSFWMNGEIILPLFRTVRTEDSYRDYVLAAQLKAPYVAGRQGSVHVFKLSKVTEREQKPLLREIVAQIRQRPAQLKMRHRETESAQFGFAHGPIIVNVTPAVLAKLRFKHKIDLNLLKTTLDQYPDEILPSPRKEGSVEVYYHSKDISLLLVLAREDQKNTTSLVTSFFLRRNLH